MVRNFFTRCLGALDRLYDVDGAVWAPNKIDVGPPVLVHDVSREAEAAQGFSGVASITITTAGNGATVFGSLSRAAYLATGTQPELELSQRGLDTNDVDVWVMGVSGVASAASAAEFANLIVGINWGSLAGTGVQRVLQQYNVGAASGDLTSGGVRHLAGQAAGADLASQAQRFGPTMYPFLLPDNVNSLFLAAAADDNTAVALTVTAFFWLWVCPKGTFPPLA